MTRLTSLIDRGVLKIGGADRLAFLQGLVSNDLTKLGQGRALWAALLTPQGKYLFDFFITPVGEELWLEGEAARLDDLRRRLLPYRLRSKVTLELDPSLKVYALWEGAAPDSAKAIYADPRHDVMPRRLLAGDVPGASDDRSAYELKRIALGLPEGSRDLEIDKALLLENGFDELGAIAWDKGCWMGQELTARTKYRALIKRRLITVECDGAAPPPGTVVLSDGQEVGEIKSGAGNLALALLRLDALAKPLEADGRALKARPAPWLKLA